MSFYSNLSTNIILFCDSSIGKTLNSTLKKNPYNLTKIQDSIILIFCYHTVLSRGKSKASKFEEFSPFSILTIHCMGIVDGSVMKKEFVGEFLRMITQL